jgi:tRNA nucleotidyltransferase (CCA-adding enzyme)
MVFLDLDLDLTLLEFICQKGISDLEKGLIRTPLPAYKTFIDDPLRVLRCIRFASKFHFEIVEDVKNTIIKDGSIKVGCNDGQNM